MTLSVRLCVTFSIQRNKESNVYCSLLSPYTSISLYVSILLRIRHVYGHLITPNIRYFMQCIVGKGMVLRKDNSFPLLTLHIIDLFSLGGLFSQCRPRDDTLENSCSVARIWLNNFKMDKREILQRTSRGLQWENKPPKLKRSIVFMVWSFDRVPA